MNFKKNINKFKIKFNYLLNEKIMPFAGKVGNQTHLSVIRDSFVLLTPLIIAGALAILINNVILGDNTSALAYWLAKWTGGWDEDKNIFIGVGAEIITGLKEVGAVIYNATYLFLALYISFLVGYFLAKKRSQEPAVLSGITSLSSFLVAGAVNVYWSPFLSISGKFLGAEGLFSALIISFLVSELYLFLIRNNSLAIKMPEGVPPAVSQVFAKLLPIILITLGVGVISQLFISVPINYLVIKEFDEVFGIKITEDKIHTIFKSIEDGKLYLGTFVKEKGQWLELGKFTELNSEELSIFKKLEYLTFSQGSASLWTTFDSSIKKGFTYLSSIYVPLNLVAIIYKFFTFPFMSLASNPYVGLGLGLIFVFFVQFFWFFGLHGLNIMNGIFSPIWLYAIAENVNAREAHEIPQFIFNVSFFDSFIFIGGWGLSLSLLLVTLLFGKDKQARSISKMSITAGLFNINEPVTFAYPLMLNPLMFIPAVFGPVLITIWTYFWVSLGIVPIATYLMPWVTPVGLGAFLTTSSWKAFVLAVSNLILGILIYLPFVLISNKISEKKGTSVPLEYLGNLHYLFTGKNFQDFEFQRIRERQNNEWQVLKTNYVQSEDKKRLKTKHKEEWIEYRVFLKKKVEENRFQKKQLKIANKIEKKKQKKLNKEKLLKEKQLKIAIKNKK